MTSENPIEEIWRIRDELGAPEGYDVHQLFERLRREEKNHADRLVRRSPRRPLQEPTAALRDEPPEAG
jgi:rubrerythrin